MSDNVIQTSFNSGEWSPSLYAQVNLKQYHSGAALLRNFFVDTRGGATTRPGTRYVATCKSNGIVRPISFQASFTVSYLLEFGDGYVRFFNNSTPVLEANVAITTISAANPPGVSTAAPHGYATGDWVFLSGTTGMNPTLNGSYYKITVTGAQTFTLQDLFGNNINATGFGTGTGGAAQRVYTIASPYAASELAQIKFTQNINTLILCHPNHPPFILTLISATNWTLAAITFGSTISPPAPNSTSTLAAGTVNYGYKVTSVDNNGQESAPSAPTLINNVQDLRTVAGSNSITWTAVVGAVSYNVYKAEPSYAGSIAAGAMYGFIGNLTGIAFVDSNINPDFTLGLPVVLNPFAGAGVSGITITAVGTMGGNSNVPVVTLSGGGGSGATAQATVNCISGTVDTAGNSYGIGDIIFLPAGVAVQVTGTSLGSVTSFIIINRGSVNTGSSTPANAVNQVSTTGFGSGFRANLVWGLATLVIVNAGTGYATPPTVSFSPSIAGASATTFLGAASSGNPTVPGFHNQRLVFGGPVSSPQQFNFSQPGAYFNYNITFPAQGDNAIQGNLVSGQLNTIQSLTSQPQGLIAFSDKQAWLINGGSPGTAVSAVQIVANPQTYSGSSGIQPIVVYDNILYVQSKQSTVRNLVFNFYTSVYTGTDISILSNHLFYGFSLNQWAWAEEPFKLVWAVRNDGQLLCLTFLKDIEIVAWTHSDTQGLFKGIATITESTTTVGNVDAVYHVVQRTVQGQIVNYIERFVELTYPSDYKSSWQVDAGIGYNGTAATTFSGAQHLGGQVVTGLADGVVINFTMPLSGTFVFGGGGTPGLTAIASASIVTVGLSFLPQLGTLPLDLGEPTVQGKRKKVSAITVRVRNALGLTAGRNIDSGQVPMQDLVLGNVGTMSNQIVTGLVTGDARTIVDPQWDVFGQYYIQQPNPYPASILGVIPEIEVGDTGK